MITHVGPSPNCGHYTAIGEAAGGQFFQFDDSFVKPIALQQVLSTASYVVFYEMVPSSWKGLIGNVQFFVNLIFILYARWRFKIVLKTKLASLAIRKNP